LVKILGVERISR